MKCSIFLSTLMLSLTLESRAQQITIDPGEVFNEFWQMMDDNYAFFKLRQLDWMDQKTRYQKKISREMQEDQLFKVMYNMIRPLNDGHTFIIYKNKKYRSTGEMPIWKLAQPTLQLLRKKYLKSYDERADGHMGYGYINDQLGYIRITAMEGFEPQEIDPVLEFLNSAKDLVVDVRFNGGGDDRVSLQLASRFADKKRFVYSKETYFKGSMNDHLDLYIEPLPGRKLFTGKIFLLTNRATFSAAEMFVMAMVSLPNCISIGENTAGAHSDVQQKTLANGWTIGLSNQIYTMPDGNVYEKIGIPPQINIKNDKHFKEDKVMDKVLSLLENK